MVGSFPEPDRSTRAEPPRLADPSDLTDLLLYRLNRLRAVGGGIVLRLCEGEFGVTRREWVLLALLHRCGRATPSELARQADLARSATSKAIVSLVGKGLVRRLPRGGDRRYVELTVSDAGADQFAQVMPRILALNARILGALHADEVGVLDALLDRLQQQVDRVADGMVPWPAADRRQGGTRRLARPLVP